MRRALFINSAIYLPGEKAIKRTFYLFQMMLDQGYDVTFLTSDFNHYEKKGRDIQQFYTNYPQYKENVRFVHMEKYDRNISVKRFLSNYRCEDRMLRWFEKNGKDFDVVYISWPAFGLVKRIKDYCQLYNCKMIIDVNDLWPDSLRVILKNDFIYNMCTYSMQRDTKRAFASVDGIVAVSEEYLEIASRENTRATERLAVYIGAMLDKFDDGVREHRNSIAKGEDEFWLIYIGTLGTSYDIRTAITAVDSLRKENHLNIRFKILGQGPDENALKEYVKQIQCDGVDFVGFKGYGEMAAYLSVSDACINCIKARASQSIINKAADYFASGKPVLNCGACQEMKKLISDYDAGINYEAENVESLKNSILQLSKDQDMAKRKGRNARRLAEEKFDREKTHQKIIELMNRI